MTLHIILSILYTVGGINYGWETVRLRFRFCKVNRTWNTAIMQCKVQHTKIYFFKLLVKPFTVTTSIMHYIAKCRLPILVLCSPGYLGCSGLSSFDQTLRSSLFNISLMFMSQDMTLHVVKKMKPGENCQYYYFINQPTNKY